MNKTVVAQFWSQIYIYNVRFDTNYFLEKKHMNKHSPVHQFLFQILGLMGAFDSMLVTVTLTVL